MFTQTQYPDQISPNELDDYLSRGWFRMGQMIFTCRFLCLNGGLYSPIWMRLPLNGYKFRKRKRRIIRKVEERFHIKIKPAHIDAEKEALYEFHKNRFSGFISETLVESLLEYSHKSVYQTFEIGVYDGDKLAAVSFFDIGNKSIASILGMFHPDYAEYSLGFYTMLAEIQYAQQNNMDFYYPGYIVHQYPKFDYKLRVGTMESFDFKSQSWTAFKDLDITQLPAVHLQSQLKKMQQMLTDFGIDNQSLLYPLYDKVAGHEYEDSFMKNPLFIACDYHYLNERILAIEYDLSLDTYRLSIYARLDNMFSFFPFLMNVDYDFENTYFDYLIREFILMESDLPEMIIFAMQSTNQQSSIQ